MNRLHSASVVFLILICPIIGYAKQNTAAEPEHKSHETAKEKTMVKLETTMGSIIIELDEEKAPVTSENFLIYVRQGFYDDTIFHRIIAGFMIQGGGFTADMKEKPTMPPIVNESSNGLKNLRGTIAMARTSDPNSATSQFFINHVDNAPLDYGGPTGAGYAVFGRVVEGMEVVDTIAAVKTTTQNPHANVPVGPVIIKKAIVLLTGQAEK